MRRSLLDAQLADNEFLAGDYSIADITNFCWARSAHWSGVATKALSVGNQFGLVYTAATSPCQLLRSITNHKKDMA